MPESPVAGTNENGTPEVPVREEEAAAPVAGMAQEGAQPRQEMTADSTAAAPAGVPAEALSEATDSTKGPVAGADAVPDETLPAQDGAAEAPLSALSFPAPGQEAEAGQALPADGVRTDTAEAPVDGTAQPVGAVPADGPVQEEEAAPKAAGDDGPAPAPAAPEFPSVPVAGTSDDAMPESPVAGTNENGTPEAPVGEEEAAAPVAGMAREEVQPRQAAAPAFPSVGAAASPLASGYVSPSLRHAGEWVGEPMPIGTPVNRPAPRQEETASAPVDAVVTIRPLRRDVSPDEIARKLGKPSLVPTDKSALITPPPRKSGSSGPAAGRQPAFPGAPVEEAPHAVPGSKEVSSLPDMTPDSTTLLASGREETSRTRAAANTLMRFLSRFHTGNSQPPDKEEDKGPQAPAATVQERQGTPRPIPKKERPPEETPEAAATTPATDNPWIERRAARRPVAPTPRQPVPPMPQRPQPPDNPDDPLPALMWRMDKYLAEAGYALEQRRLHLVADAAGRLAAEAESYGFRVLGRMARCVESAGRAKDLQAVTDLLPELATAVERHRISLGS